MDNELLILNKQERLALRQLLHKYWTTKSITDERGIIFELTRRVLTEEEFLLLNKEIVTTPEWDKVELPFGD